MAARKKNEIPDSEMKEQKVPRKQNPTADPLEPSKRFLAKGEVIESDYGRIILPDNDDETVDELTRLLALKREKQVDIAQSKISGRILSDTLVAVEKVPGDFNRAILYHGDIKVIIPGQFFFPDPEMDQHDCNFLLARRVGARIDYVIDAYEKDETGEIVVAAGNRRTAMQKKAAIWMIGSETQQPKIQPGDITQARVLSVEDEGYMLECGGLEAYIPETRIRLNQGQSTLIRITEKTNRKGVPSFRGQILDVGGTRASIKASDIILRSKYLGNITNITNDGVFVAISGGVSCYCTFPETKSLRIGQRVSVYVTSRSSRRDDVVLGRILYIAED